MHMCRHENISSPLTSTSKVRGKQTNISLPSHFPSISTRCIVVDGVNREGIVVTNITPRIGVKFLAAWILLSVSVNVSLTFLICLRIVLTRRQLVHLDVFEPRHLAKYMGVVAILVESALPLAASGVVAASFFMFGSKVIVGGLPFVMSMWYFFSVRLPWFLCIRWLIGN